MKSKSDAHLLRSPDPPQSGIDAIVLCGPVIPQAYLADLDERKICEKCMKRLIELGPIEGKVYLSAVIPGEIAKQEECA